MKKNNKTLLALALFSIAMGFFESAVVIYLRKIYYPDGFRFPLAVIERNIILVELLRELATIIMLWSIGYLAGKSPAQRFSNFLFCFGTWDLFYYVFLKVFLNWPESFLTPDILFLIPVPWVGPVLAPCIVSLHMIASALLINSQNESFRLKLKEKLLMITGALVIILSFTIDYKKFIYMIDGGSMLDYSNPATSISPGYNWWIFLVGEAVLLYGLYTLSISATIHKESSINKASTLPIRETVTGRLSAR